MHFRLESRVGSSQGRREKSSLNKFRALRVSVVNRFLAQSRGLGLRLACLVLFVSGLAAAQSSSPSQTTFTSNTELVMVPVHVTDHYGRPLRGLKQQDFVLKADGTPQRIAFFNEMQSAPAALPTLVEAAGRPAPEKAVTAKKYSNQPAQAMPQELTILALDTVNTPLLLQTWAREQAIRYLRSHPRNQPLQVVAITPSGLRQVHGFTTDSAALIQSVNSVKSTASRSDDAEVLTSHMDRNGRIDSYASLVSALQDKQAEEGRRAVSAGALTLRSFEQMAWAYSGIPGRKTVVWLTCGFPLGQEEPTGPAMIGHGPGRIAAIPYSPGRYLHNELLPQFQRAFTALNKANVIIYPVDVKGLPLEDMWDVTQPAGLFIHPELSHFAPPLLDPSTADRDGMKEMARRTGGRSCTAGNSLQPCIDQALAESADYYLLGFYVSQQQRRIGWHKLKVSVGADHGEVRARSSYYLRPLGIPPQREQEDDLRSAIQAAVDYTGVIFNVEPGVKGASNAAPVTFKISVPPTSILLLPGQDKLSFDVIAIPLSNNGSPIGANARIVKLDIPSDKTQKALATGWTLLDTIPGSSSLSAVKVIVRDNGTGRVGSVAFPLTTETASATTSGTPSSLSSR